MRTIEYNRIVEWNLSDVWKVWTMNEGVQSFFAPSSNVVLEMGGKYEIYFIQVAPVGSRGSEGMKIQSYIPERILAFDWNHLPVVAE